MWLATVTNATNDCEQWRGLTYLDGLAAKFPEVVDYYLADERSVAASNAVFGGSNRYWWISTAG
jgi:hypothetical protein